MGMIVPISEPRAAEPRVLSAPPSPVMLAMAAAHMDEQGRLFEPQQMAQESVHTIERGPEFDKWDEALQQHGRIRLPKDLDEPQKWLNKDQFKGLLQNIDREDKPDGSVILSKRATTS